MTPSSKERTKPTWRQFSAGGKFETLELERALPNASLNTYKDDLK